MYVQNVNRRNHVKKTDKENKTTEFSFSSQRSRKSLKKSDLSIAKIKNNEKKAKHTLAKHSKHYRDY